MRKCELIEALRLDDYNRNGLGINDDAVEHAVCEQDDQSLRYELSHANSRPAGVLKEGWMKNLGMRLAVMRMTGRLCLTF